MSWIIVYVDGKCWVALRLAMTDERGVDLSGQYIALHGPYDRETAEAKLKELLG